MHDRKTCTQDTTRLLNHGKGDLIIKINVITQT